MKKYKLPVTWEAYGILEIEAEDDMDFLVKLHNYRINNDELPLPTESEYVDGSFQINDDDDMIEEMNKIDIDDISLAKIRVKIFLSSSKEYPFDEWIQISDKHDLNLWIDEETDKRMASLFPVKNGQTDTSVWTEIDVDKLEEKKNVIKAYC